MTGANGNRHEMFSTQVCCATLRKPQILLTRYIYLHKLIFLVLIAMHKYWLRRNLRELPLFGSMRHFTFLAVILLTAFVGLFAPSTVNAQTTSVDRIEVQTLDGCRHRIAKNLTYISSLFRWHGICHKGYSLGPGLLVRRDNSTGKNILTEIRRVWSFDGRIEGESEESGGVAVSVAQVRAFEWEGVRYELQSMPYSGDPEDLTTRPALRFRTSQEFKGYYIRGSCTRVKSAFCIVENLQDMAGKKENLLPCKSDCMSEWKNVADPFLTEYRAYLARHSSEIEKEKRSLQPTLAPLLEPQVGQLQTMETELYRELEERAVMLAANTKESQARHKQLLAESAAAETDRRATERREFWSKALDGLVVVAQAAAEQQQAKNRAAQPATGSLANGSNSLRASSRDNGSATGGAVGQNRGKGGNPDYLYDDVNHGNCVSVKVAAGNTGSKLAYGRYSLINRCAYPLKLLACVNVDSADGKPSPTFDNHQDGQKCPGMGWGGTTLKASEIKENKTWFEYRNIKWQIRACREGWDFIGEDGRYPSDILGARFSCRMRRP